MKMVTFVLLVSVKVHAKSKEMFGSVHGDSMTVSYRILDDGKHVLAVARKSPSGYVENQTVALDLKNNEFVSAQYAFRCFASQPADKKPYAYAILDKYEVKEGITAHPKRAWLVDEKETKLIVVKDPQSIECSWYQEGDGEFPFKTKN